MNILKFEVWEHGFPDETWVVAVPRKGDAVCAAAKWAAQIMGLERVRLNLRRVDLQDRGFPVLEVKIDQQGRVTRIR